MTAEDTRTSPLLRAGLGCAGQTGNTGKEREGKGRDQGKGGRELVQGDMLASSSDHFLASLSLKNKSSLFPLM